MNKIIYSLLAIGIVFIIGAGFFNNKSLAQDVGPGVCVKAPGYPCGSPSSSGGGGGGWWSRPYIETAEEEAARLEREKNRKINRQNRKKFKGITSRMKMAKKNLANGLFRLNENASTIVKSVTYEQVPGDWGTLFIPGDELGNIIMARPVNPTPVETQISREQLAKVGALYNFIKHNASSSEDMAFLANQAASIMVGARSYVHITFTDNWEGAGNQNIFQEKANQTGEWLDSILEARTRIRKSEGERAELLNEAKKDIKKLAKIKERLKSEKSDKRREKLEAQAFELDRSLSDMEDRYFEKKGFETKDALIIEQHGNLLKRRIEWIND